MMRPTQTWILFGVCLAVVLAAMALVSYTAVKLDRQGREHATREENVRLALWRMECALGPLIAQESGRPYFWYRPFYPATRAYTRMYAEIKQGEVLVPSPLLTQLPAYVLLHFQIDRGGEITSPQAPTGNDRDLAEAAYTTNEKVTASTARLLELKSVVSKETLARALGEDVYQLDLLADHRPFPPRDIALRNSEEQGIRNTLEWQARASQQAVLWSNVTSNVDFPFADMTENTMKPVWVGGALVLARQVFVNGQEYIQGCWLDWPGIKKWLLDEVSDLLPAADLEPAVPGALDRQGRTLAALPVRLVAGAISPNPAGTRSGIPKWLLITWVCVLVAAGAVAALLRGTMALSERRGAFVSAVTHELRTPLTTLRMYTEMLSEGIVSDEDKVRRYLRTLRVEADRLGHLVVNVLAFARLEGRRDGACPEPIAVGDMIGRVKDRLSQRAEQAGMRIVMGEDGGVSSTKVLADVSAVEQILFNLVDNASKYAASASDPTVHLEAGRERDFVFLRVRDHGPGVPRGEARRLFRPFCKSARDAANSAPGIGLGLALSRRLARRMGGELRLDNSVQNGACFILTLPAPPSRFQPHVEVPSEP